MGHCHITGGYVNSAHGELGSVTDSIYMCVTCNKLHTYHWKDIDFFFMGFHGHLFPKRIYINSWINYKKQDRLYIVDVDELKELMRL